MVGGTEQFKVGTRAPVQYSISDHAVKQCMTMDIATRYTLHAIASVIFADC